VALNDNPNCIEHAFATRLQTALKHTPPFFRSEGLFTSWAGFPYVTSLGIDDSIASAATHNRYCHSARHNDKGVLAAGIRIACKLKAAMKFWVRKTCNRRVDLVLTVAPQIHWPRLRTEIAPVSRILTHTKNGDPASFVRNCDSGLRKYGPVAVFR
jgi:hypothetical protein